MSLAVPQPSATLILLRDAKNGPEVFMVKRHSKTHFGGLFVFPGGVVDAMDSQPHPLTTQSLNDKQASKLLNLDNGGLCYFIAAIRETFEETGYILAKTLAGDWIDTEQEVVGNARSELLNTEKTLIDICKLNDWQLALENVYYFNHWITPAHAPRRFDTRFFIAKVPDNQCGSHDGRELVSSQWLAPQAALEKHQNKEMPMITPTLHSLQSLQSLKHTDQLARYALKK